MSVLGGVPSIPNKRVIYESHHSNGFGDGVCADWLQQGSLC